ncbi:hypothetical protein Droror1_Dr00005489 [Drosera rotundifolia]
MPPAMGRSMVVESWPDGAERGGVKSQCGSWFRARRVKGCDFHCCLSSGLEIDWHVKSLRVGSNLQFVVAGSSLCGLEVVLGERLWLIERLVGNSILVVIHDSCYSSSLNHRRGCSWSAVYHIDVIHFPSPSKTSSQQQRNAFFLLVISLTLLYSISVGRPQAWWSMGGWQEIKNITDPYMVGIAEFAVTEHDKKFHAEVKFGQLLAGEYQVINGANYRIAIEAFEGSIKGRYAAFVTDRPWQKIKVLKSFEKERD